MWRFPAIDGLRGLAILMVTLFHLWVIPQPSLPVAGFNLAPYFRFGHMGVSLFFTISGFCLFYPLAKATAEERTWPSWRTFWLRRAVRILPAYWLAVGLWFAWWYLHAPPAFAAAWARQLLAHLTFTHIFWPDTCIGVNVVLWSLATEVHFYILFPLLALVVTRWPLPAAAAAFAPSVVLQYVACHAPSGSVTAMMTTWLPGRLSEFLIGMYAAHLAVRHARQPLSRWMPGVWAVGLAGLLAVPLIHHAIHHPTGRWVAYWWWDCILYAPCWGALILLATTGPNLFARAFAWRPIAALGIVSYSVYLYNPLPNAMGKLIYGTVPTDSIIWWVLGFALVVAVGAAGYAIAERPFLNWRAQLRQAAQRAPAEPVAAVTPQSQFGS